MTCWSRKQFPSFFCFFLLRSCIRLTLCLWLRLEDCCEHHKYCSARGKKGQNQQIFHVFSSELLLTLSTLSNNGQFSLFGLSKNEKENIKACLKYCLTYYLNCLETNMKRGTLFFSIKKKEKDSFQTPNPWYPVKTGPLPPYTQPLRFPHSKQSLV